MSDPRLRNLHINQATREMLEILYAYNKKNPSRAFRLFSREHHPNKRGGNNSIFKPVSNARNKYFTHFNAHKTYYNAAKNAANKKAGRVTVIIPPAPSPPSPNRGLHMLPKTGTYLFTKIRPTKAVRVPVPAKKTADLMRAFTSKNAINKANAAIKRAHVATMKRMRENEEKARRANNERARARNELRKRRRATPSPTRSPKTSLLSRLLKRRRS
jgi:hypothetical protein